VRLPTRAGRRPIGKVFLALLLLLACAYGSVVLVTNHSRPMPSLAVITEARLSAAGWILAHRDAVLNDDNPILWSMVARSAALTNDPALLALVDEYLRRSLVPRTSDPFRKLFGLTYPGKMLGLGGLERVQDYQVFFLYALTCDPQIIALARVAAQLDPQFCPDRQPLRPACTTHQLMGLRLAEDYGCLPAGSMAETRAVLLNRIERQLFWDVRLVDTYIQRALMLTDERGPAAAGAPALHNILEMQMPDGGWSRSQPMVPIGRGKWLGVTESGLGSVEKRGQFHATAQVLLLLSLVESGLAGNR
jgi:hypothetical protein